MTTRDIPDAATLIGAAMKDDDLFSLLQPYSKEYPASSRAHHLRRIKMAYFQPDVFCMVGVADEHEKELYADQFSRMDTPIMGLAFWMLQGKKPFPAQPIEHPEKQSYTAPFELWAATLHDKYMTNFGLDQSADRDNVYHFRRIVVKSDTFAKFEKVGYHLHLRMLAVHPELHRKGLGTMLVKSGIEYAKSLGNVPVTLRSSKAGRQTYRKLGFKIIDWDIDTREDGFKGTPLPTAPAMILDPEQKYTRAVDPEKGEDKVTKGSETQLLDVCWNFEES